MGDLLGDLAGEVTEAVYSFGYPGIFVLMVLSNLHLPIPSQLTLALAGFLVGQGRFSLVAVMGASTAGAVAASLALYFPGLWIGEEPLRRLVERLERFKLVFVSDLDKANEVFQRHGGKAILIGHLVPGVGAFISIPAGIKRMPILGRFAVYTVLGSTLWNAFFVSLGWWLGSQWELVEQYAKVIEYVLLAALALGIVWLLGRRWKKYR